MSQSPYKNYYKNHAGYGNDTALADTQRAVRIRSMRANFLDILSTLPTDAKILEIGCGQAPFAYMLRDMGYTDYTGYDLDTAVIQADRLALPQYIFSDTDVRTHLAEHIGMYDMVFMSHVFEHLTIDEGVEMAQSIYAGLRPGGIWLNIMPNAASLLSSTHARYADYTHRVLYSGAAFTQLLGTAGYDISRIVHRNTVFPYMIFEYWQRLFRFFMFLLHRSLGYMIDTVGTFEIVSIIRK
jgi:2-polyprenyl-3-methyl-5-hydroxy-6-metoxy-1,4-benzoquinol methylase